MWTAWNGSAMMRLKRIWLASRSIYQDRWTRHRIRSHSLYSVHSCRTIVVSILTKPLLSLLSSRTESERSEEEARDLLLLCLSFFLCSLC
jgi:hypothetical protein